MGHLNITGSQTREQTKSKVQKNSLVNMYFFFYLEIEVFQTRMLSVLFSKTYKANVLILFTGVYLKPRKSYPGPVVGETPSYG